MTTPYDRLPPVPAFPVTSEDLVPGGQLPTAQWSDVFGAGGQDRSPHLAWSGFPAGTESFVVTCFDPDAPTVSGFWHWAVVDLPVSVTCLPGGAGDEDAAAIPAPAFQLRNDAGRHGFLGAAPPPGHGRHRYLFVVHAVGAPSLGLGPDATNALLGFHLSETTVARATLTCWHER